MEHTDCVFCKIVAGEIPAQVVYEDDKTLAFLDVRPVNNGHTLVIPKNGSATNIFDVTPEDWAAVMETVRKVSNAIEKSLDARGVNLMMNNREHAGQVVDHVHVHIIPRFVNDGLKLWPQHPYKEGEADVVAEKIRAEL